MTDKTEDEFFTPKHERLARIASVANVFAWIVFIVQVFAVGARFLELQYAYMIAYSVQSADFMKMLSENPHYTATIVVSYANSLLRGVVYALVLKGISLGLNMILETDLNYKEKYQEGSHE